MRDNKVLIAKGKDKITIFCNGKRLIINKNDEKYNELIEKSNEDILKWYEEVKLNG